ncbi:MAG: alkaline phosphatase family protein, partial [Thaumarchaeota archaeon]|nr:alkaline phosphatase family protein [Nitrososphaerota archaeon]
MRVIAYLMKQRRYDFVMTVLDGIDSASHCLWKYIDEGHPKYNPKFAEEGRKAFYRSYELADEALGQMISMFDSHPNVVLLSDHGNGPVYYGVYINNWLVKNKHLALKRTAKTQLKRWAFQRGFNLYNVFKVAEKLGLLPSVETAYAKRSRMLDLVERMSLSFLDVDWEKTKAYSYGNYGQLFVNLKGREPHGIVEPGHERETYVHQLVTELAELTDPKTGQRIFDQIHATEDMYHGAQAIYGPDVLFLDSKMLYDAHRFFEFASNSLVTEHPVYSGNHKPDGVLICAGPDLVGRGELAPASIIQITPTILALHGIEIPSFIDGDIVEAVIGRRGTMEKSPPALQITETVADAQGLTEEETVEITDRLKDLGY